jgi:hypothetical protein
MAKLMLLAEKLATAGSQWTFTTDFTALTGFHHHPPWANGQTVTLANKVVEQPVWGLLGGFVMGGTPAITLRKNFLGHSHGCCTGWAIKDSTGFGGETPF